MSARQDEAFEQEGSQCIRDAIPFVQISRELAEDPVLSPTDKAVYLALCIFTAGGMEDGRCAFPKIKTIAGKLHVTENTARSAIKALVARGYVECRTQRKYGHQGPNIYIIHNSPIADVEASNIAVCNADETSNTTVWNPLQTSDFEFADLKKRQAKTITKEQEKDNTPLPPKGESEEKSEAEETSLSKDGFELSSEGAAAPVNPLDEWFDKFWAHYPRPEDKKRARRTFMALFHRQTYQRQRDRMNNLIVRLTRYLADCEEKERRYIKLPATWLNAHDFDEEPGECEKLVEENVFVDEHGKIYRPARE